MDIAKRYTIAYKGLTPGLHDFHFEVDGSLFAAYDNSEIKDGACEVAVVAERAEAMHTLDVTIDGSVVVACDRCLEDCRVPIHFEGQLLVKFSDEPREYDGEVLWLMPVEDEIDLTQYIYESIVLALPYQRVHPEGECNPEMLERFRIVSEKEFEKIEAEAAEPHNEGEWAKLAALKEQMEAEEGAEGKGPAEE
ncbi:DUF177 domain-containing protein [uncultured Alistipes sp.]|uniref:YceD family protein n=1 Tax=uncultured Alistipes sp. TaxID=538949 RepID=UPI0025D22CD2|nr:DUF177 domain-containing protein [uncultured Alistipes sp.]